MIKYYVLQLEQMINMLWIIYYCLIATSEKTFLPQQVEKKRYIFVKSKLISLYAFTDRNCFFQEMAILLIYLLKEILMLLYLNEQDTEETGEVILELAPVSRLSCKTYDTH